MATASSKPCLRPVETIVVPDGDERVLLLRDTQGITTRNLAIPLGFLPIARRFDGRSTCTEIAKRASAEIGETIPVDLVIRLATELEESLYLEGPLAERAFAEVHAAFATAAVREATHAGGAYHGDPTKLHRFIEDECESHVSLAAPDGFLSALVAPHIDPWRGKVGYGHAYGTLRQKLDPKTETVVVFGTSHAPMREPFALCDKAFATPFGDVPPHESALADLAQKARFDAYADVFNHKREHSIEFQIVFLKHLFGARPFRIIPVLAGLGKAQARGRDPEREASTRAFLDHVAEIVERESALVVAGADFAHVGPRFGDPRPLDERGREDLETTDRHSIDLCLARDANGFFEHVSGDQDTRRVCGTGPIYGLLRTARRHEASSLLHYEQTIDPEEGSIVSHAAVGFFR